MTEIVKICKKHGELTKEQIHPKGKSKTGKQYYGCRLCKKEVAKRFHENNFESERLSAAKYHQKRKLNPEFKIKKKKWMHYYQKRRRITNSSNFKEKERIWKRQYTSRHKEKILERMRIMTSDLHPSYVRWYLKYHYGFENPSNELVHAKATIMLLKREIMKLNANLGKNKYVAKTRKYKRGSASKDAENRIIEGSTEDFISRKDC